MPAVERPSFALRIILLGWLAVFSGIAFLCWLVSFVMHVLFVNFTGIK